jgi:hypothetical protein
MKASLDKEELMAGLAELEKRVREHKPPAGRPAASPDRRLDLDLAAIEAAVKARSVANPATLKNAGLLAEPARSASAPSPSVTLDVAPDRELRAFTASKGAFSARGLEVEAPDVSRERTPPPRPATIDLFAEKERSAPASGRPSPPPVADAAPPASKLRQQAPASRPAKTDPVPETGFRAAAAGTESAPSRPHRWIYAAAAILIVIGSLLGGAGYFASGKVLAARRSPSAPQKLDPSPEAAAATPAPESTADVAPATPAPAEETAAAALRGGDSAPLPEPATQAAHAAETSLAAPVGAAAASAIAAPPAAKAASVAEPPAPAAAPASETPDAKPAKKPKKHTADKSEDKSDKDSKPKRHAKDKVAKPRPAPEASIPAAPAQPQALAAPPPPPPPAAATPEPGVLGRAGQAVGSITGTVKGWVGLDSGAHPQ